MALLDVLADARADEKPKKGADKKYVTFSIDEWKTMEATHGKEINPADVKKIVMGIFGGKYTVSVAKPKV